jgi:parvulin-like peptidyl-prolyl isomerase
MRDQIASSVSASVEQVHAVQILLYNLELADQVYTLLQSGQDFSILAWRYDPDAGGELGWFPRGYLTEEAIETAAFNLQPGQYSPIVQTRVGYHILYVVEREPQRQLDGDARLVLQEQALDQWLEDQRQTSQIELFVP